MTTHPTHARAIIGPLHRLARRAIRLLAPFVLATLAAAHANANPTPTATPDTTSTAGQRSLLFIASPNVPRGKFRQLAEIGAPQGFRVDNRYLNEIEAGADAGLFAGYDAVFFDSALQQQTREALAAALPGLKAPHAWLHERAFSAAGLPEDAARTLNTYYLNGGQENFQGFFTLLDAALAGRSAPAGLKPPIVFPAAGVYHPKAPQTVFATAAEFLRWKGVDATPGARRPPVIAIAMHQQNIAAIQTGFVDDLVARIEQAGAVAMPVYNPIRPAGAMGRLLRPDADQPPLADAVINLQFLLDAEGRRQELMALGLPVLQANTYFNGDADAWRADPQGVPVMAVPFMLAQPEYTGIFDIQTAAATRERDDELVAIPAQAQALVNKALALVALQRKPAADQQLALMFWNAPGGEKNISAALLNVPASILQVAGALRQAGYDVPQPPAEDELITRLQRLLAPAYRAGTLAALVDDGLAELLPVAQYERWLQTLPAATREKLLARWGQPADSPNVVERDGARHFVIPRLQLGKLALLPLPARARSESDADPERVGERERELYHAMDDDALPPHAYLASYLWVREGTRASDGSQRTPAHDALIHFGTHGTQEWLPGKERGLSVFDPGMLAVGDIPVVYPYTVDNVGEAIQARRRGRAVIVSHQTPPFKPAGLHGAITELHDWVHHWQQQDEGAVKAQYRTDILQRAEAENLLADMGWRAEDAAADFDPFITNLHSHLEDLAGAAQPMGLHTFGATASDEERIATLTLMLGQPFREAAQAQLERAGGPGHEDETWLADHAQQSGSAPFQLLWQEVAAGRAPPADAGPALRFARPFPPELQAMLEQARQWWQDLDAGVETEALLAALAGRHVATSYGGDPIKSPDALPTGHNLYGFDPSRVPTAQAWKAGQQAAEQLIAAHREQTGQAPKKLTITLWSVETMRHLGLLEAQALWLLGAEPVWDEGGRVTGVKLVSREALGRPRVDVVLSATGLYRDAFPNVMQHLARAAQLASEADAEADNPVAANTARILEALRARGLAEDAALDAAQTRIFSSQSGHYATGLDDATAASDSWEGKDEGDRKLAETYLARMQYAYGPDPKRWGQLPPDADVDGSRGGQGLNLYAEQLRGTEGAVLSRSSNVYGMLTSTEPFEYLGGIALAVRHLDGKAPQLYISNLRGSGAGRTEAAAQFLAKELATRQFHPGYIENLMKEGYAGTLEVVGATSNLWGWTATAREIVRDDQWQTMVEVYVRDKYALGLQEWFEQYNPHALAQTIERMLEAARQGYWQTDEQTLAELRARWLDLAERFDVRSDNARFAAFVRADATADSAAASGFGLDAPAAAADTAPAAELEAVRGQHMERVDPAADAANPEMPLFTLLATLALLLLMGAGAATQARRGGPPTRHPASP